MSTLFRVKILAKHTEDDNTTVELQADQIHPEGTSLGVFSESGAPPDDLRAAQRLVCRMLADATSSNALAAREDGFERDDFDFSFIDRLESADADHVFIGDFFESGDSATLDKMIAQFDLDPQMLLVVRNAENLLEMDEARRDAFGDQHSIDRDMLEEDNLEYFVEILVDRRYELWRSSVRIIVSLAAEFAEHLDVGMEYETSAYGG